MGALNSTVFPRGVTVGALSTTVLPRGITVGTSSSTVRPRSIIVGALSSTVSPRGIFWAFPQALTRAFVADDVWHEALLLRMLGRLVSAGRDVVGDNGQHEVRLLHGVEGLEGLLRILSLLAGLA